MTEFTSSHGIVASARATKPTRTFRYLYFDPEEHPISAQLFGSDPVVMADAARHCQDMGFDIVDINFGCPVKKVVTCNGGSACCAICRWLKRFSPGAGRDFDSVDDEVPRRLERSRTGDGEDGATGRKLRAASRRPASAHARARLQRAGRLDPHCRSESGREDSGDRQRRYCDAGRRCPHGARNRLRRRDGGARGVIKSLDLPPDSRNTPPPGTTTIPPESARYEIMRSYYAMLIEHRAMDAAGKMKQFATYFTHGVRNGAQLRAASITRTRPPKF